MAICGTLGGAVVVTCPYIFRKPSKKINSVEESVEKQSDSEITGIGKR